MIDEKLLIKLLLTNKINFFNFDDYRGEYLQRLFHCIHWGMNMVIANHRYIRDNNIFRKDLVRLFTERNTPRYIRPIIFKLYGIPPQPIACEVNEYIKDYIINNCSSNKKFKAMRETDEILSRLHVFGVTK
jgi:hypothetical protein